MVNKRGDTINSITPKFFTGQKCIERDEESRAIVRSTKKTRKRFMAL